ncbi:sensor histidine kinase [Agromyces sp. NPDC127015]|uniref:sensor histidine kinase n=1 Tax=Agromyces sp. NPDC127015 TaxID=3347108 RepID=UPI00364E6A6A
MPDPRSPVETWNGRPPWAGGERRPPAGFVLWAPVVVSLLVQLPAAIGIAFWLRLDGGTAALQIALAVIGPFALLASRRFPGPTVAVVTLAALADVLLTPDAGPPYAALAFAIVLGVARGAVVWAAASVVTGWAAAIALGPVLGVSWHPARIAITTLALAACFGIGWFARARRARFAAMRAEAANRRRTAEERERVRIARELHDVIGHALSQINVQASVGLHLMDRDAEQARTALANIKETSKTALDEVRSVLGVIRDGDGGAPLVPQAELAELPRLVRGLASPGFSVALDDRLDAPPGRAVQFAAYRIVQEALTNVVRHAGARHADVVLERADDLLVVTVDDDGSGLGAAADEAGEGRGILGMRERAALLGGTVELGRGPLGGTRVRAELPWGGTA